MRPVIKASLHYLALSIVSILWLIPVYAMIINGFKSNLEALSSPVLSPPRSFSLTAYITVFNDLAKPLINSLIVVIPTAFISAFLGAMGAYFFYTLSYSFSKFSSTISDLLFSLIALATFIPYQATLIPLTRLIVSMGILDTYIGIIFAMLIFYIPTGALLMSMFISVIPRSLIEAAKIDGTGDLKIFMKIVLPLSMPGFISTLIFIIIQSWNNFFIPLILITTPNMRLVSVAVQSYTGGYGTLYNDTFAAAMIASIVPLAIFIFLGRYFIRGLIALGGGKGV
ncbi:glucose ABC transporter permease GlcU [Thermoproteus tenax]|uniref:Sugar ABC transporter, permease protein n=1 Tax=Thermoproteus tenax (strain ATCC 35583 / DSM 2078 / JCM 9277 / NBRC 100435 / Kra 1) TaxID=768679 RepID=G4RMS3_THETK|nr:glucose ABC transporter permease GlcU [Thermoproteus tenax]CCC80867.1 sugar ABC transporter, permease protein [Thermoproteus tenax Kra 1]